MQYGHLDSTASVPRALVDDVLGHTLEYLPERPTAQEFTQHQLVTAEVGQSGDLVVCRDNATRQKRICGDLKIFLGIHQVVKKMCCILP